MKLTTIILGATLLTLSVVVVGKPPCPFGMEESYAPVGAHYEFQGCIK